MDATYQIVTNLSCNLDCEYCYERKYPRNNKVADVVDFIHACFNRDKHRFYSKTQGIDGIIIDIIGGEPFMQPKLLKAAFETAEELCNQYGLPYVFSISTNGTLFDKPLALEILNRWKDKLSIGVSIDGLPETHDKYRIFTTSRQGSYQAAVAGYKLLQEIGVREIGVKATFTKETLMQYGAGMKSLIDVTGGGRLYGNVVFEDVLPRQMALEIANQFIEVAEYFIEKGLHLDQNSEIGHVLPDGLNVDQLWNPDWREKLIHDDSVRYDPQRLRPHCGTTVYMTCLGFDRNIFGCNRFMSTVTTRQAIGKLEGQTIVNTDGGKLLAEVQEQWKSYPDQCIGCPAKHLCASCVAAAYENGDGEEDARKEYHGERRQCGWTTAKLLVAQWWKQRFGSYESQYDKSVCNCYQCQQKRNYAVEEQLSREAAEQPLHVTAIREMTMAVEQSDRKEQFKNEKPAAPEFYEVR